MDPFMKAKMWFEENDAKRERYYTKLIERYIRFCMYKNDLAYYKAGGARLTQSLDVVTNCLDKLRDRLPAPYAEMLDEV